MVRDVDPVPGGVFLPPKFVRTAVCTAIWPQREERNRRQELHATSIDNICSRAAALFLTRYTLHSTVWRGMHMTLLGWCAPTRIPVVVWTHTLTLNCVPRLVRRSASGEGRRAGVGNSVLVWLLTIWCCHGGCEQIGRLVLVRLTPFGSCATLTVKHRRRCCPPKCGTAAAPHYTPF